MDGHPGDEGEEGAGRGGGGAGGGRERGAGTLARTPEVTAVIAAVVVCS